MSLLLLVRRRRRETTGEKRRGSVMKAIPLKSAEVVSTLRVPFTIAPPKLGSAKYFILTSQVTNSSAPEGTHGVAMEAACDPAAEGLPAGSSLHPACSRLRYRRSSSAES